jgi:hypothetical protein
VFVRHRHEGIEVPVLLPLDSFTWGVEHVTQKTKKSKCEISCLYRYSVRPLHPEITADDLFVFNFVDPLVNGTCTASSEGRRRKGISIKNNNEGEQSIARLSPL